MDTQEQFSTEQQNPLTAIKNKNLESIDQLNEVLSKTLGSRIGRALSTGFGIIVEYVLYAVALGVFLFIFMMEKVSPFFILSQMRESQAVQDALNPILVQDFSMAVKILVGLIAFFIFTTAYALRKSRKNTEHIQDTIVVLKDVRGDIEGNNKRIDELNEVSDKMMQAANLVAYETKPIIKKTDDSL